MYIILDPPHGNVWAIKNLKIAGHYNYLQSFSNSNKRCKVHDMFDRFDVDLKREMESTSFKYAVVQPTRANVANQVLKYDKPISQEFRTDPLYRRALALVEKMFEPIFISEPLTWEQSIATFDLTKSPGIPWTTCGFRTKGQVFSFAEEFVTFTLDSVERDSIVYFGTVGKGELLEIMEIDADKIRLFSPGPAHFLAVQAKLYSKQNELMMNFGWSGYGVNLFRGGCNSIAQQMQNKYCFDFDIPRCDKSYPMMSDVYAMRNRAFRGIDKVMGDWVAKNLITNHVVLPDGTVIVSNNTNPSGQGNTTTDNILYACTLVAYALITICPDASDASIMAQFIKSFGDDVIGAVGEKFKLICDKKWLTGFLKAKFGIDLTSMNSYEGPTNVHWLGAHFRPLRGVDPPVFVPHYNPDRLYDSWRLEDKGGMRDWQILSKLRSLLILSYPHETLYEKFRICYTHVLRTCARSKDSTVKSILRLGMPSSTELVAFYTGFECSSSLSIPFLSGIPEEIGVNFLSRSPILQGMGSAHLGVKRSCMNVSKGKNSVGGSATKASWGTSNEVGSFKGEALDRLEELVQRHRALKANAGGRGPPTEEEQRLSVRSGKIGAAIKAGVKRSSSNQGGKAKTVGGNQVMVTGGERSLARMGPNRVGGSINASVNKGQPVYTFRNSDGSLHSTAAYVTAGQPMPNVSVPVARGSAYRGSSCAVRETNTKAGRVAEVRGHQFLGTVGWGGASSFPPPAGSRAEYGMYIISPDALGGSLQLFAQNYEQHRAKKLRILYVPNVPATEPGAIAMYFRNDVNTPVNVTGLANLTHAATHPSFIQTQVWEPVTLDIDPTDATMTYFDTDTGDARLQVQGIFEVIAASRLEVTKTYGNLYLEYDIEFSSQELDFEVEDISSGTLAFDSNAKAVVAFDPMVCQFNSAGAPPGSWKCNLSIDPPSTKYIFACTLTDVTVAFGYTTQGSGGVIHNAANYEGFFMRVYATVVGSVNYNNDSISGVFFSDYASAVAWDGPNGGITDGQWLYAATGNLNTDWTASLRALPISYE